MTHLIFSKKNRIKTQSLCKDVQDISWRTWNLLRNAHLHDITIGEETITDINLLELQRRRTLTEVITKKLSRADEAMIGADWIWVLIGKSGRTLVLYVQAKKLFTSSGAYNSLIKSSNPFHQVNTLISNRFFFAGIPMYPIYVFYNYVDGFGRQTRCSCGRKLHTNLLGCTFSDALEVKRKIHKGQSQYSQLKDAQCSLSCLFCRTPSKSSRSGSDLPGSAFNKIVNQESMSLLNEFNASPENFLLEEPPSIIRSVLNGEEIEQNPFEFLGVNRIVVMQESQITENE